MKQYISTKLVKAQPAYLVSGKLIIVDDFKTPIPVPRDAEVKAGYKIIYLDGYESWCPRDVFERAYLPLTVNPELKTDRPSISQEMVEDFISEVHIETLGDKCTVVRAVLRNGFKIVESSACVSSENYDEALGKEICLNKIESKVWELLGFLLQTATYGVNGKK